MRFPASLFKVAVDSEGAARIQLDVPSESLSDILPLAQLNGCLLDVEIKQSNG